MKERIKLIRNRFKSGLSKKFIDKRTLANERGIIRNVMKLGFIFNLINRAEIKGEKILCKFLDQNSVQVFLFFSHQATNFKK